MTRNGKIARLPKDIREELNRRLEDGEAGVRLIEWLNGLPEVVKVLAEEFEGVPINDVNLSQWKNGGFLDWQARQRAEAVVEGWGISPKSNGASRTGIQSPKSGDGSLTSEDGGLRPEGGGLKSEDGAGSPMSNLQSPMSERISAALTERLMVHYAAALEDAIAESDVKASDRVERLGRSLRDMVRVRRARERAEMEREWMNLERERLELQRTRTQARGANTPETDAERERELHLEQAEMVKQMVREAKAADEAGMK